MSGNKPVHTWAVLLLLFIASINLNNFENIGRTDLEKHMFYLPSQDTITQVSLGYNNFLSTLYWVKAISYFGTYSTNSNFDILAQILNLVTSLNPKAEHAYYMAAALLPWNTGSITQTDPLLQRAMQSFPEDWRWPYYRGFNHYWFQHDTVLAAHYLGIASSKFDSPSIITSLALRMRSENGNIDTALTFLDNLLSQKKDKQIHQQLLKQRNTILTEKILRQIDQLLARLPNQKHDARDLEALRKRGIKLPFILPDKGTLTFNAKGELLSSASSKRFKIFTPRKKQVTRP